MKNRCILHGHVFIVINIVDKGSFCLLHNCLLYESFFIAANDITELTTD